MEAVTTSEARWGDFKAFQERYPGAIQKTKAYALLKEGKLRAKKFGSRVLWSFDAMDELIESLEDA